MFDKTMNNYDQRGQSTDNPAGKATDSAISYSSVAHIPDGNSTAGEMVVRHEHTLDSGKKDTDDLYMQEIYKREAMEPGYLEWRKIYARDQFLVVISSYYGDNFGVLTGTNKWSITSYYQYIPRESPIDNERHVRIWLDDHPSDAAVLRTFPELVPSTEKSELWMYDHD